MPSLSTIQIQDLARDPEGTLARLQAGEPLVVVHDGRPVAELRPLSTTRQLRRPFGLAAGEFKVPNEFDDPLPEEILAGFEG